MADTISVQLEIFRKLKAEDYLTFQDRLNEFLNKLSTMGATVVDVKSELPEGLLTIIILYERASRDIDGKRIKRD